MPYFNGPYTGTDHDSVEVPRLVADMNTQPLAFTVFDGDTKGGSSPCDDASYQRAADMFNSVKAPTVYVPGDNEWTDCDRPADGGYSETERLTYLRQHLFASPLSFGEHTMLLEHQGAPGQPYSENTRWSLGPVTYAGLNVPGSNNNADPSDGNTNEYVERNAANIAWLRGTFDKARAQHSKAVMVIVQADMGFDLPETDVNELTDPTYRNGSYDHFNDFLGALIDETEHFPGQVVLVHGDTHFFKIDKPLLDQGHQIQNFTRVETFGSPDIHWVKATVDANDPNVFEFAPMTVAANADPVTTNPYPPSS